MTVAPVNYAYETHASPAWALITATVSKEWKDAAFAGRERAFTRCGRKPRAARFAPEALAPRTDTMAPSAAAACWAASPDRTLVEETLARWRSA